ncbi:MAG TPA: FMN-binding negative transcriptional regulator [Aromatoleum sp.]|uniref:FMN-binding negative transcriptional regulator n=1 Tax=Aromatoleum sp. TaxID=2307007 RepID=UPI002B487C9D|nr:FMN-binding negative transcriptional regulator [Aromatoleum sp.]HJV24374.1 FMN-binding negative transcriptional regulator [Aromatoleum sp.]
MYLPQHFEEARRDELRRLIEHYPFGAFVINGPNGLDANHLPFEFDAEGDGPGRLLAHVARANPVWQDVKDGDEVLVIFRAGDAYISPNWYPSKHETHRQVPTWNYRVVHVHGKVRVCDDEKFVRGVVGRLTRTHEARAGEAKPWKMADSDKDYIDGMLAAIVGIEVEIARIVGKSKLGQNKDARDRVGAAQRLQGLGETEISAAMLSVPVREA